MMYSICTNSLEDCIIYFFGFNLNKFLQAFLASSSFGLSQKELIGHSGKQAWANRQKNR